MKLMNKDVNFYIKKVFIEQPEPHLFKFEPMEIMQSDIRRFKEIELATR